MVITMKSGASLKDITSVLRTLEERGARTNISKHHSQTIIGVVEGAPTIRTTLMRTMPGVESVDLGNTSFRRVSRGYHPHDTLVRIGSTSIGDDNFHVIAGPCAVESESQIHEIARFVATEGATLLRAGAFKPRTSPYSFQGLGVEGLRMLASAARSAGIACVSEIISIRHLPDMVENVDMLQVGARNMQNFDLLRELGRVGKPVLLKRGVSATIEELLLAAEYVYDAGNPNVVLCERGIRTYEPMTRNTLDIAAVPLVRQLSHLPIIVDPSHACGRSELVLPLALASKAAGAFGVMIEVHSHPEGALSDGRQSLDYYQFRQLMDALCAPSVSHV